MLKRARGFTLVELMVAMAIGLVVVAAALAFVLALVRTHAEVVLSTRLDQELRATMTVLATDLRRARSGAAVLLADIDLPAEDCVRFAHDDAIHGVSHVRLMRLDGGSVVRVRTADVAAATCAAPGVALNSESVEVTRLSFTRPQRHARRIDILLSARLRTPPAYLATPATRTLRASIALRSNEG